MEVKSLHDLEVGGLGKILDVDNILTVEKSSIRIRILIEPRMSRNRGTL